MRRKRFLLLLLGFGLWIAAPAAAEYIDLPVKYSQTPWDPDLYSWGGIGGQVYMADDFVCDSSAPIVAVRWWGGYVGETVPRADGHTGPFEIRFHYSVSGKAAGYTDDHPYSLPGTQVYLDTVTAQEVFAGYADSVEFDPQPIYRYDAMLSVPFEQWTFSQSEDNGIEGELWIGIHSPSLTWGWHMLDYDGCPAIPVLDYAAYSSSGALGDWQSAGPDNGTIDTDMTFELMGPVPIPAAVWLLGSGLVGLVGIRRKFNK